MYVHLQSLREPLSATHHIVSPVAQDGGNVVNSVEDGTVTGTQRETGLLLHHLKHKININHL